MRRPRRSSRTIVVLVTCPSQAVGRRLAHHLIHARVAACVNVVPGLESVFWWEGKVDRCREVLLVIKTTAARFAGLRAAVLARHPYKTPEIIALPIVAGHPPYLQWVCSHVASS